MIFVALVWFVAMVGWGFREIVEWIKQRMRDAEDE